MDSSWITTSWTAVMMVMLTGTVIYLYIIALTQLMGLRSFAKMASFDFAMTVAIGSLIATTLATKEPPLLQSLVAIGSLFLLQFVVALVRVHLPAAQTLLDNTPLLLMAGEEMLHDNLKAARVTESELRAKLRAANVLDMQQVRAVVMETTGDISVMKGDPDGTPLDLALLQGVKGRERLMAQRAP